MTNSNIQGNLSKKDTTNLKRHPYKPINPESVPYGLDLPTMAERIFGKNNKGAEK